jgi:hypothetical protein
MKVTAGVPKWMKLDPNTWYKAYATADVAGVSDGDKVWLKQNTEFPYRGGLSYWLYDPIRKTAAHISDKAVHDFVRLFQAQGHIVPATPKEQKVLDKYWAPVVKNKVDLQRKISKKYNQMQKDIPK